MRRLIFSALLALVALSALNWRAQLQTQQKLDALAASLAERSAPVVLPPAPQAPAPVPAPAPEAGTVPRELSNIKLPPYVIEAPDVLTIEAALKDPKVGTANRLAKQPV